MSEIIEKLAFSKQDRGFSVMAYYRDENGKMCEDARIEIRRGDVAIRNVLFPAYKIWNIAAHFEDIVDSELANDVAGYAEAASDGLGGGAGYKPVDGGEA